MYAQSTLWDPLPYNSPCTLAVQVPRQAGSVWGPGSIPGRFWRTGVPSSGVAWQGHCTSALLSICRPAIALTFVHVRGRLKKKKKKKSQGHFQNKCTSDIFEALRQQATMLFKSTIVSCTYCCNLGKTLFAARSLNCTIQFAFINHPFPQYIHAVFTWTFFARSQRHSAIFSYFPMF